jgi:hypothetical protein
MVPTITERELATLACTDARGWYFCECNDTEGLIVSSPEPAGTYDAGTTMVLAMAGGWGRSGLPTVTVSRDRMRAFIGCQPESDHRPRGPWDTWIIRLPTLPRISFVDRAGGLDHVRIVVVVYKNDLWSYFALGESVEFTQFARSAEFLRDSNDVGERNHFAPAEDEIPLVPQDQQAASQLGWLILNSTLALGGLQGVDRVGPERAARDKGLYPAGDYVLK